MSHLLKYSNIVILISFIAFLLSLQISYINAEHFSLNSQITAHISTIIFAAIIKVAYVVRCACLYHLGMEVR
ncbi:hypothetical protein EAG18_14235 [Pseudoalteromonas sp. J010]|uniref:Uncharacterized protein n=1 Tax=Pseudoalteromonas peptidolytica F12-50-A1 TaxID=1315280 RepID=A0A8I0N033_9GAMM|nr:MULTISPECIES: hypothetical protein [Pseudoalteromonas]MBE0348448.1 hypothetical protein [Pseudoalteromonas peptidolytica F12-50-A1]NLR15038.1 hypothetical protein [Pseudoalteromonas peptidolytica]RRS07955.1 hypothetical protein EAG18_14235 [Pseudoalteromonas sp. J010]GEK10321.1 hypothetical protein PPE03_25700 [Pseudoalteromonas peptidolytica]